MKALPEGRNKATEEANYKAVCHRRINRRQCVEGILQQESFFDASQRPEEDVWSAFYAANWAGVHGPIKGSDILSALRDHLATIQNQECCYCRLALLKGGYSRPIEHVLCREYYPRYTLHFWNLAVACERCNRLKKNVEVAGLPTNEPDYPDAHRFSEIYHPRLHSHKAHISVTQVVTDDIKYFGFTGKTRQGKNLVTTLLKKVALEMNTTENSDAAEPIKIIREHIQADEDEAAPKMAAFNNLLMDAVVEYAQTIVDSQ